MLSLGPLAFVQPWLLLGLAALPGLWWLLRATPPAPRRVPFPAVRLLHGLHPAEETPERTPWWLLLLRLLIGALAIIALAGPVLNPATTLPGSGPVVLAVDNGWAAAANWPARQEAMLQAVAAAEHESRSVILLPTSPAAPGAPLTAIDRLLPAEARGLIETMTPNPWPVDRAAAAETLEALRPSSSYALWMTDGIESPGAITLGRALQRLGRVDIMRPGDDGPLLLRAGPGGGELNFVIERANGGPEREATVRLLSEDGRLLARAATTLAAGARQASASASLPTEARNRIVEARIEGESHVGAILLLDERWRRRPVGIVEEGDEPQPLLSETYYLSRALTPFAEVRHGTVESLAESEIAVLILADGGQLTAEQQEALISFMERGGVVLRFAGPLMATAPNALTPTPLRAGDRRLSGSLSWTEPQPLAPFPADSPFAGLETPADIRVERQVLAEPGVRASEVWARLADGTPLITGRPYGEEGGLLILVHVTAGPAWSNLPLSGLYVDILRRVVELSAGIAGESAARTLQPIRLLDGFGRLVSPAPGAPALPPGSLQVSPGYAPGFYGEPGTDGARHALNLSDGLTALEPLSSLQGAAQRFYGATEREFSLTAPLLAIVMSLFLLDFILAMALAGRLRLRRQGLAALTGLALFGLGLPEAGAQEETVEATALAAANGLYLAYVQTGDSRVDETSRTGLEGLSAILMERTSVEADGAMGVDPETDELAFYPFLYWPITDAQPSLGPEAAERLNRYLAYGGTIVFDTRDRGIGSGGAALQRLTADLDIPPLTQVPPDHVLTRSFYLMQEFPGRYAGGEVWVQDAEETVNDGVTPVIIGGNDWAAAWARDERQRPLYATVPASERQREMAYRFGINLVMYMLTGNYKADQVHMPSILERLGQ